MLLADHNTLLSTEIPSPPDLEVLIIEIKTVHALFCVTYISPSASSNYRTDLIRYLNSTCASHHVVSLR